MKKFATMKVLPITRDRIYEAFKYENHDMISEGIIPADFYRVCFPGNFIVGI